MFKHSFPVFLSVLPQMSFPSLSEAAQIKGKSKKAALVWRQKAAELMKGEPLVEVPTAHGWATAVRKDLPATPAYEKRRVMWYQFDDEGGNMEGHIGDVARACLEPMEGPMDMATAGARRWNEIDARWNRIRPSSSLSRYTGEDYWERRVEELYRRGGDALVREWRAGVSMVRI